jgi:citrate lyase subunit beta/citryl-CoA lyase
MIAKAAASAADLVFLDLEDAVAPSARAEARVNIAAAFNELDWGRTTRAFRINAVGTEWCYEDLLHVVSLAGKNVDIVIMPKVRSSRDVWFVDDLLTQLERKHGLKIGGIGIEVLIEEAEALARVEDIAAASDRVEALILGLGDLAASHGMRAAHIGATSNQAELYPGDIWHYARSRLIGAARANGLDPIDGPFGAYHDIAGYLTEAARAATLGAVGKWCIHPNQIELANQAFSPTAEEVAQATRIVTAIEAADANGVGAATVDGAMVDAATARIFGIVLERARLCGHAVDNEASK